MPKTMSWYRLVAPLSASPLDKRTRELMHHYQTSVFITLAGNRRQSIYRVSIPQLGLAHPFLLSGIRAISALHLSTLIPSRKHELRNIAVTEEDAALLAFRTTLQSPNFEDAVDACFAFTGSAVYYVMGLVDGLNTEDTVDRSRIPRKNDENPHWFQMSKTP